MDDQLWPILVFAIGLSLIGLGFIWYANETRKHAANLRIQALDLSIDPQDRRPAFQDLDRAKAYEAFLADKPQQATIIPIRNGEAEEFDEPKSYAGMD